MRTVDWLLGGAVLFVAFLFFRKGFQTAPAPAVGNPYFSPPIKAGQERAGFTGNPISASRPNEIFGAPQPPVSNSRMFDGLVEQGVKFALTTKYVQDARTKYGF